MSDDHHLLEVNRSGYTLLTLNRPQRKNALTHALVTDIRVALERADSDPRTRAVVITGAGEAFSAGADLAAGRLPAREVLESFYNPLVTQMDKMATPIVAAVNGVAAGAGLAIALAADMRLASENASFVSAFVKMGLVPDAGTTWYLPRVVGFGRAQQMALLGERVDSSRALSWGLVNEVTGPNDLLDRSCGLAAQIAALPSSAGAIRRLMRNAADVSLREQLDAETEEQSAAYDHDHFREARAAFLEKRSPVFY